MRVTLRESVLVGLSLAAGFSITAWVSLALAAVLKLSGAVDLGEWGDFAFVALASAGGFVAAGLLGAFFWWSLQTLRPGCLRTFLEGFVVVATLYACCGVVLMLGQDAGIKDYGFSLRDWLVFIPSTALGLGVLGGLVFLADD